MKSVGKPRNIAEENLFELGSDRIEEIMCFIRKRKNSAGSREAPEFLARPGLVLLRYFSGN